MIINRTALNWASATRPGRRTRPVHRPNGTLMARTRGKITQADQGPELPRPTAPALPTGTQVARGRIHAWHAHRSPA
ncbi:hypothetical protein GCM10010402_10660 [Actinomadura luteofluorescens]